MSSRVSILRTNMAINSEMKRVGSMHGDLSEVSDVAVNASGFTYAISKSNSLVQVFGPDGDFSFAWYYDFQDPESIAINRSGYVYVADGDQLVAFNSSGGFVGKYQISNPLVKAILDLYQYVLKMLLLPFLSLSGGGGPIDLTPHPSAIEAKLAIGPDDNLYVASSFGWDRIRVYSPNGTPLGGTAPEMSGFLLNRSSEDFTKINQSLLNMINATGAINGSDRISLNDAVDLCTGINTVFDFFGTDASGIANSTGTGITSGGAPGLDSTQYSGIAVNSTGYIYVTAPSSNLVRIYPPVELSNDYFDYLRQNNTILLNITSAGSGAFNRPTDIAINASDCVFILDSGNSRTVVIDRNSSFVTEFGTAGTGDGQFLNPQGLGIAPAGNKLAIADTGNNRTETFDYFGRYYDQAQVTVDNTPPVIAGAPVTAANANGWHNAPVTVHFNANDATSGVLSCTGDRVLSGEGANQSVTGTAIDGAGNVNVTTVNGINIDLTPPVINCSLSGDKSDEGWFESDVTATLSKADNLSGVDYVKYRLEDTGWNTYDGTFVIPLGIQNTLYYVVTDKAGNNASGSTNVYFPPASYPGNSTITLSSSPSPSPSPSPTNTSGPAVTPGASPAASPGASPATPTPQPVGQDMLFGVILIMVIATLVRSRK